MIWKRQASKAHYKSYLQSANRESLLFQVTRENNSVTGDGIFEK